MSALHRAARTGCSDVIVHFLEPVAPVSNVVETYWPTACGERVKHVRAAEATLAYISTDGVGVSPYTDDVNCLKCIVVLTRRTTT